VTPIPAQPPIGGVVWSLVVPALLWLVTFAATWLLYRHFSGKHVGDEHGQPPSADRSEGR
jgi:hypothetical protein